MNTDAYKPYLLGLVFYKALSDRQLIGSPEYTFGALYQKITDGTFSADSLNEALHRIEHENNCDGLFDDFDINSKELGRSAEQRSKILAEVMQELVAVDFAKYSTDALGDAYEYLIAQFAANAGKKAGEFYTPQAVAEVLTRIVTDGKEKTNGFCLYDACMGSGSLLLQAQKYINENCRGNIQFYGQELSYTTYNLARANMILHNVPFEHQHFKNGDSLANDWPTEGTTKYDAVAMNPPYSQKWSADKEFLKDPRFSNYEKLAPKSKADFAFLLHGFYHLKNDGTMGIVLPHGVLFRGAGEGTIRRHLIENGSIYAVIGLPAGIFFNTTIPTCLIVLRKTNVDYNILFIDASQQFRKGKKRNFLEAEHIDKIVSAYKKRKDIDKFAHLASFEEVKKNDFNLNIPRYVDITEPEPPINLQEVCSEMRSIDADIQKTTDELITMMGELKGETPELDGEIAELRNVLKEGIK